MAAIPVISATVGAIGTLSTISSQAASARAQKSALENEKTNAAIQADISNAEQEQQYLIASTQQEINKSQTNYNYQLQEQSAVYQREVFNTTLDQQRSQLELARLTAESNADTMKSQVNQQRLASDAQAINQQAEAGNAITKTQQQLSTVSGEELDAITRLAMASRANRFGTTGSAAIAALTRVNDERNASIEQLNLDKQAIDRYTQEQLTGNQELEALANTAVDTETNKTLTDIELASAEVDQNERVADTTLSAYREALKTALASDMTDAELQAFLLEETQKTQARAIELNKAASNTRIDSQASSIKSPGLFDYLSAGTSIFGVYNAMTNQQQRINETKARTAEVQNMQSFVNPVSATNSNPFYGSAVSNRSSSNVSGGSVNSSASGNNSPSNISRTVEFSRPNITPEQDTASRNWSILQMYRSPSILKPAIPTKAK